MLPLFSHTPCHRPPPTFLAVSSPTKRSHCLRFTFGSFIPSRLQLCIRVSFSCTARLVHRHCCDVEMIEPFFPGFTPPSRNCSPHWERSSTPPCPRPRPRPCRSAGTTRTPACQPTLSAPLPSMFSASRQHCSQNSGPQATPSSIQPRAPSWTSPPNSHESEFHRQTFGSLTNVLQFNPALNLSENLHSSSSTFPHHSLNSHSKTSLKNVMWISSEAPPSIMLVLA